MKLLGKRYISALEKGGINFIHIHRRLSGNNIFDVSKKKDVETLYLQFCSQNIIKNKEVFGEEVSFSLVNFIFIINRGFEISTS